MDLSIHKLLPTSVARVLKTCSKIGRDACSNIVGSEKVTGTVVNSFSGAAFAAFACNHVDGQTKGYLILC